MSWIKVSDKLPEPKDPEDELSVNCLIWKADNFAPGEGVQDLGCYSYPRQTWLTGDGFVRHYETVTHWMPLPEPPKAETSGPIAAL
jgi:hypothetical protein